jgi:hypothetical protein
MFFKGFQLFCNRWNLTLIQYGGARLCNGNGRVYMQMQFDEKIGCSTDNDWGFLKMALPTTALLNYLKH